MRDHISKAALLLDVDRTIADIEWRIICTLDQVELLRRRGECVYGTTRVLRALEDGLHRWQARRAEILATHFDAMLEARGFREIAKVGG